MTPADLEAVILKTGHERYRWLTSDANPNAHQREAYRRLVARLAAGAPEPAAGPAEPPERGLPPLADGLRALRLGFRKCWFSTQDSPCGCSGVRCHLHGRIVGLADCIACLARP